MTDDFLEGVSDLGFKHSGPFGLPSPQLDLPDEREPISKHTCFDSDYDNNLLLDPASLYAELYGAPRSPRWPQVRSEWLAAHNFCFACGGLVNLEVHHKRPFHLYPELELNPSNFVTLCSRSRGGVNCHLFFGHLGNWVYYYNPDTIEQLCTEYRTMFAKPNRHRLKGE